jgi:hypothetical protein
LLIKWIVFLKSDMWKLIFNSSIYEVEWEEFQRFWI